MRLVVGSIGRVMRRSRDTPRIDNVEQLAGLGGVPAWEIVPTPPRPARIRSNWTTRDGLAMLVQELEGCDLPARTLAVASVDGRLAAAPMAIALAQAWSLAGPAVLAIDLTADRQALPEHLRFAHLPAFDDLLAGLARWSEALLPLTDLGPWLLTARRTGGGAPPSALTPLLAEATRRFDRVLVATSPLSAADGRRAAGLCARTLALVHRRRTATADVRASLAELDASGGVAAGTLLVG